MEAETDTGRQPDHLRKKKQQKTPDFRNGKLAHQEQPRLYLITRNDNADDNAKLTRRRNLYIFLAGAGY